MEDDDLLRAKTYTLVRDPNNKLYLVGKNQVVPLEDPNNPSPVPSTVVGQVHGDLEGVGGVGGVENTVEGRLAQYLPQGSGVRVRVPKILD
jgi:hypothetical protein